MKTEIRCRQCGEVFGAVVIDDRFGGACPKCIAGFAFSEEPGAPTETASEPPPLKIGATFRGMKVLELLGQGGMGVVYKARQVDLDRIVALKILSPRLAEDPEFAQRFNREAKVLASLNHPGIVHLYEFGREGTLYYLAMEFVEGVSLRGLFREKRLTPAEALRIVPQICEALEYAHSQGVVHRDIKPENILVDRQGRVKIADFGLARMSSNEEARVTRTNVVMGTPAYMAPEQHEGAKDVDHRADIYALGVVFYEMLTGELPVGRFEPPSQRVQVDVRLDEVVLKALEKRRERRYQRAEDVRTDLHRVQTQPLLPTPARHVRGVLVAVFLTLVTPILVFALLFVTTRTIDVSGGVGGLLFLFGACALIILTKTARVQLPPLSTSHFDSGAFHQEIGSRRMVARGLGIIIFLGILAFLISGGLLHVFLMIASAIGTLILVPFYFLIAPRYTGAQCPYCKSWRVRRGVARGFFKTQRYLRCDDCRAEMPGVSEFRLSAPLLLLAFIGLLVWGGWSVRRNTEQRKEATIRRELELAARYEREGRPEDAQSLYERVLAMDPTRGEARQGLERVKKISRPTPDLATQCRALLTSLIAEIESVHQRTGSYPPQDWERLRSIVDPWGQPFVYRNHASTFPKSLFDPTARNKKTFDLFSNGPNGIDEQGGGDDILGDRP